MPIDNRRSRWSSYQSRNVGENRLQTNAVLSVYSDIMGCTFVRDDNEFAPIDSTLYRNNVVHSYVEVKARPTLTYEKALAKGWVKEMFMNFSKIAAGLDKCLNTGAPFIAVFAFPPSNIAVSRRIIWKTDSGCVMVAAMKTKMGKTEYGEAAKGGKDKNELLALIDITTPDAMKFSIPNLSQ